MKSLKGKLIIILFSFIVVSILASLSTAYYYNKKENITVFSSLIDEFEISLLQAFQEQENFFNFELNNRKFFETKESEYLDKYESFLNEIDEILAKIQIHEYQNDFTKKTFLAIDSNLKESNKLFLQMQNTIQKRGFKDFGLEGQMRESIHFMEDLPEVELAQILMLRRHEKDYFLRQDPIYLKKHEFLMKEILADLGNSTSVSENRLDTLIKNLSNYQNLFEQVALFERMIGLKSNRGYKRKLNESEDAIILSLKELKIFNNERQAELIRNMNITLVASWLVFLIFSVWACLKIANRFTINIVDLSRHISFFVNSNFSLRLNEEVPESKDEVGKLWTNFKKMQGEIIAYIDLFKEKVDEKTFELIEKNKKIEKQKVLLEAQKKETDEKNKDLLDGIRYGWRIQQALMPDESKVKKDIEDGFILFSPKDVVSGDVFWTHKINTKLGRTNFFSVIDCTGHGVPGAFMSILALKAIEDAVISKKHRETNNIVYSMNNYVYSTLKYYKSSKDETMSKDGMELSLCKLNRAKSKLYYTGARRPLYIIRKINPTGQNRLNIPNELYRSYEFENYILFEIAPDKSTVGVVDSNEQKNQNPFSEIEIQVEKEDMIYLFSDGYADQFGGERNKKLMTKNFKSLLVSINHLEVESQKNRLLDYFINWQGNQEQIDDVCVMGVRV